MLALNGREREQKKSQKKSKITKKKTRKIKEEQHKNPGVMQLGCLTASLLPPGPGWCLGQDKANHLLALGALSSRFIQLDYFGVLHSITVALLTTRLLHSERTLVKRMHWQEYCRGNRSRSRQLPVRDPPGKVEPLWVCVCMCVCECVTEACKLTGFSSEKAGVKGMRCVRFRKGFR